MTRDAGSPPDLPEQDPLARALVGALMRGDLERRPVTAHPVLESLIAYRTGAMGEAARASLQEHLGGCPDCVRTLRELDEFVAPGPDQPTAATDLEEHAGWRRLQPALREQIARDHDTAAAGSPADTQHDVAPAESVSRRWSGFASAAAVLAATTGALLVQTHRLENRLAKYDQPSAEVSVLYVESRDQRAAGTGPQRYDVPAAAPSFLLMIESPDLPAQDCCEIEIANEAGTTVWKGTGVPGELGALRLSMPSAFLPAGVYWIVVRPASAFLPAATSSAQPPLVKERIEIRYQ